MAGASRKRSSPEIVSSAHWGNPPKNLFVQTLAIALAMRDRDRVVGSISEDITWLVAGAD